MFTIKFALYAVALCCAAVALFLGGVILGPDPESTPLVIFFGATAISALCLWLSWRWDRVTFVRFSAVMSLIAGLIAAMVLIEWDTIVTGAVVVLGIAVVIGAASGWWLWRYYRSKDPVPDVLRELFDDKLIMERLDVQIAYLISSTVIAPLGTVEARIYLQNCCRGPRRVKAALSPERPRWWKPSGPLRVPAAESFELQSAEVGYLSIPIQASEDAEGTFDLWLELAIHGSRGDRIRKRRARELSLRWPWWFRFLGLLGGHLLFGGGAKARIEIDPEASLGNADPTEGTRWHRLYPEEEAE